MTDQASTEKNSLMNIFDKKFIKKKSAIIGLSLLTHLDGKFR